MSETSFPINDLLRRRVQTSLVITGLTLSVGSTIFLLLLGVRVGFRISLIAKGSLTVGFSKIFLPFLTFLGFLTFAAGATIVSFMVYLMMRQRVKDMGLMKAVGCPNDLVFGYFTTELLVLTFISCILGVALGLVADYAVAGFFYASGFGSLDKPFNPWMVLLVFVLFFAFALVFGAKPILDATKVEPVKAISPAYQFGLERTSGFKVVEKSGFLTKIALRGLFRRKSATIRIVVCLSVIFVLLTVAVAGGVIAGQTTKGWLDGAMGEDLVLIGHWEMGGQYEFLLSKFYGEEESQSGFNYTSEEYLIGEEVIMMLDSMPQIWRVDQRLVLMERVEEVPGFILEEETGGTVSVGDHRNGTSLIVGVEPRKELNNWYLEGKFLEEGDLWNAVIGDSLSHRMFSMPLNQSISVAGTPLDLVGVCIDPLNNGNVTYVPLETLEKKTGFSGPNIVLAMVDPTVDRESILEQIGKELEDLGSELEVFDLSVVSGRNQSFLGFIWSLVMFLPLLSLVSGSLCLMGYVMLTINEERRELGVLRAVGLKPKAVVQIVSEQSLIVLLSSFCLGVPIGIILTLLFLIPDPVVTGITVLEVAGWLSVSSMALFISSLYPAWRIARRPILNLIGEP